jgi:predicted ATPase
MPFFIEELAAALAAAGRLETAAGTAELGSEETLPLPDTIKETVLLRTERLSPAGRHTLEIAAAAGLGIVECPLPQQGVRGLLQALKEVVADLTLENRLLKKSMTGDGGDEV